MKNVVRTKVVTRGTLFVLHKLRETNSISQFLIADGLEEESSGVRAETWE